MSSKQIFRNLVLGVIGAATVIDSISGAPSVFSDLRSGNYWLHTHLTGRLGEGIGALVLALALTALLVQLLEWRRGSAAHKKLAGFAFLGALVGALVIALPFIPVGKNSAPKGAVAGTHAIGENHALTSPSDGHEKLAVAPVHDGSASKPGGDSDSSSEEIVSDVHLAEGSEPAATASSVECGCSSDSFVKHEPNADHWKGPAPAPAPAPEPQAKEKPPTEEFFEEEDPEFEEEEDPEFEEEEEWGPEEEEFAAAESPNAVSVSSSSSGSSVTVNSNNSHVSVNTTGGSSETVVTSTSESSSTSE